MPHNAWNSVKKHREPNYVAYVLGMLMLFDNVIVCVDKQMNDIVLVSEHNSTCVLCSVSVGYKSDLNCVNNHFLGIY